MNTTLCPLCNSFQTIHVPCSQCGSEVEDRGRYMDYFDDYSAYLEIDGMKQLDGLESDLKNNQCPHVLFCANCNKEIIYLVNEI